VVRRPLDYAARPAPAAWSQRPLDSHPARVRRPSSHALTKRILKICYKIVNNPSGPRQPTPSRPITLSCTRLAPSRRSFRPLPAVPPLAPPRAVPYPPCPAFPARPTSRCFLPAPPRAVSCPPHLALFVALVPSRALCPAYPRRTAWPGRTMRPPPRLPRRAAPTPPHRAHAFLLSPPQSRMSPSARADRGALPVGSHRDAALPWPGQPRCDVGVARWEGGIRRLVCDRDS
jgi:hypothetical protein